MGAEKPHPRHVTGPLPPSDFDRRDDAGDRVKLQRSVDVGDVVQDAELGLFDNVGGQLIVGEIVTEIREYL